MNDSSKKYLKYSGIAFQMLGTIIIGILIGTFLDNRFGTDKIFTAIFTLVFVVISLYLVLKEFIQK